MSANSIQAFAIAFPQQSVNNYSRVDDTLAPAPLTNLYLRTLSDNNASPDADITGLLYTPDLPTDSPCIDAGRPYVPANVTRQPDLPDSPNYTLIPVAPWISPQCTLAYLQAAEYQTVKAFLFFPTDNSTGQPAPSDDPRWALGDNGAWKSDVGFPVYVLPGLFGQQLLQESARYSGNITSAPHGAELAQLYGPNDYARLFIDINITSNSGSHLPNLWVFLLVVLAVLLALIGITSIMMHWLQRRRRRNLRNRVVAGEIDLEALGVKRLTVPQEILNTLPLYPYGTRTPNPPPPAPTTTSKLSTSSTSRPTSPNSYNPTAFQQPTCAICLDDFLPASPPSDPGTTVRELPCHHIFHPECVDAFLRSNSSLCPMCKKSALPKGHCPNTVTNAMVRRERLMRQRGAPLDIETPTPGWRQRLHLRGTSGRPVSAPMTELATPGVEARPGNPAGRREWARQRAVVMLGRRVAPLDPEGEEAARTPAWRKVLGSVWPGLGGR